MPVNTILLEFQISKDELCASSTIEGFGRFEEEIVAALTAFLDLKFTNQKIVKGSGPTGITADPKNGIMSLYYGPRGSSIAIRSYPQAETVTINIDYYKDENDEPLLTLEECRHLEEELAVKHCREKSTMTLPAIKRGHDLCDTYFLTDAEGLLEYDSVRLLFNERSKFQHIKVLQTESFGNVLILDNDFNLAESDLIYTESIMRRGIEDYKGKDILILGGGDGGLLRELVKENPRYVFLVEIDELVVDVARRYLRGICGDILDDYKECGGENYKVVIGDCIDFLASCKNTKREFDYIFADLTAVPIFNTPGQHETVDFIKKTLNMSFAILKSCGKFMTQGHASNSKGAAKMYSQILEELEIPVVKDRYDAFVPSFREGWAFYKVERK